MVVNFKTRGISWYIRKLIQTSILIKKKSWYKGEKKYIYIKKGPMIICVQTQRSKASSHANIILRAEINVLRLVMLSWWWNLLVAKFLLLFSGITWQNSLVCTVHHQGLFSFSIFSFIPFHRRNASYRHFRTLCKNRNVLVSWACQSSFPNLTFSTT